MKWALIVLIAALPSPLAAETYFITGNTLHDHCQNSPIYAERYVMGVMDGAFAFKGLLDETAKNLCISPSATSIQVRDLVCKDLSENPENRDDPAALLIWNTVTRVWPCR